MQVEVQCDRHLKKNNSLSGLIAFYCTVKVILFIESIAQVIVMCFKTQSAAVFNVVTADRKMSMCCLLCWKKQCTCSKWTTFTQRAKYKDDWQVSGQTKKNSDYMAAEKMTPHFTWFISLVNSLVSVASFRSSSAQHDVHLVNHGHIKRRIVHKAGC